MSGSLYTDLAYLQRKRQLLRDQVKLLSDNGLALYNPHPKQDAFHRANYKRRYARFGNRGGKSTMGATEDCAFARGAREWLPEGDPARYSGIPKRSTVGVIITTDWPTCERIFTNDVNGESRGKLLKYLPAGKYTCHKGHSGYIDLITVECLWGGTSAIYLHNIQAYKHNPQSQESADWDWVHVDEPCPEEMYVATTRGLVDRNGAAWFTCTPITEMWINDKFWPSSLTRADFETGYIYDPEKDGDFYWSITGSIYDNPYNEAESTARFVKETKSLKDGSFEARIHGRPKMLAGAIYKEFDSEKHIYRKIPHGWKDFDEPPTDYTIRIAIDPHPKTNHATLFAATAPSGFTYFFAELFEHPLLEEYCKRIVETLAGREPLRTLVDPSAWIANPEDGSCWADTFGRYVPSIEKSTKELSRGILEVQQALSKCDPQTGVPWLRFSPYLTETLREFDRYVWGKDEKPVDQNDHMMENLYRLVLTGLDYISPQSQVNKIIPYAPVTSSLTLPKLQLLLPGETPPRRSRRPIPDKGLITAEDRDALQRTIDQLNSFSIR